MKKIKKIITDSFLSFSKLDDRSPLNHLRTNFLHSGNPFRLKRLISGGRFSRSIPETRGTRYRSVAGRWARMPQISMKNGRSKLPRVSLMLLALITPTKGFYSFIVLVILRRGFVTVARRECSSLFLPRSPFLRFNFGRYTFKASSEFPVPAGQRRRCRDEGGGNTGDYSVLF